MNDEDWALCVGIEHYAASKQLVALPGARNDALAIHAWLTSPIGGGVPDQQAKLILSQPPDAEGFALPTTAEIEAFLQLLYRRASQSSGKGNDFRAGRRLWLFYSGHGIGFPKEEDTGLLTADAFPPDDVPHVAGAAWAKVFRASKAFDEVVLFMDCCRTEANRIPLRLPSLKQRLATEPGRMMAAFAVAESRAAYEIQVEGASRGKFTSVLEGMLRDPPERPLGARRFLELLENVYPGVDPYPPRKVKDDIILFPAIRGAPAATPPVSRLIAHGETTLGLAQGLARAFQSPPIIEWAGDVTTRPREAFKSIRDLIITRRDSVAALDQLVKHVGPRRTIILGDSDPGVSMLAGVRFMQRKPEVGDQSAAYAADIERMLAAFRGTLVVEAHETLAHLRVWGEDGHVVGEGYGSLTLRELPVGPYRVRASLGPFYTEAVGFVRLDEETEVSLPALVAGPKVEDERARFGPAPVDGPKRQQLRVELPSGEIVLNVPCLPSWTTQVFSAGAGATSLSVRMLPPNHSVGMPLPTDLAREALRLALAAPAWAAPAPTARELAGDPVALLLAAALQMRNGSRADEFVDAAAALLGDDDPDVRLLRGGAKVAAPPLLSWAWQHRLEAGTLEVETDSLADRIVGRRSATDPWLAWTGEETPSSGTWLAQLATTVWPGWDTAPDRELTRDGLDAACVVLGSPASSVRGRAWKSPPVDRLVQHERVAFLGASNDQLAPALAIAFVERKYRKWDRLDVWFLTDAMLASLTSAGRTGRSLITVRNRAEDRIRDLLTIVAVQWSTPRYDGLLISETPCFASLWDWTARGGYVHVSERDQSDVRTSPAENLVWSEEQAPERFGEVVRAYDGLVIATANRK